MNYKNRELARKHLKQIIKVIIEEVRRAESEGRLKLARSNGYIVVPLRRMLRPVYVWQQPNVRKKISSILNKFPDIDKEVGIKVDRRSTVTLIMIPESPRL